MISSLAPSTLKQYNTTFKKWWNYCQGKEVFIADQNKIIAFLNDEFNNGANYSTINQHRSALNTILPLTDQTLIKRFLKGVFRIKPVFPRYNETWDPNPVLEYLEKLAPLHSLSLENLTYKLVLILALISSQRVQTLTKIKLSNIVTFDDRLEIKITDIIKTSAPNKYQPKIVAPIFHEKPNLCIASVIKHYIELTKILRCGCEQLLITIKKPHHAASPQTVSNWIKKKDYYLVVSILRFLKLIVLVTHPLLQLLKVEYQ